MKTIQERIERLGELRNEIFDIANSFAGDQTGNVAVQLHGAANILSWSKDQLKEFEKDGKLPTSSLTRMLLTVNLSKQMEMLDRFPGEEEGGSVGIQTS